MSTAREPQAATAPGLPRRPGAGAVLRLARPLVRTDGKPGDLGEPLAPPRIARLRDAGGLTRPAGPAAVVYRLESGQHRQTGVIVEVSVDAYRDGRLLRHEATDPERERRLAEFAESTGTEQVPVMSMHPPRARLSALLEEATVGAPEVRLAHDGDPTHSVWFATEDALVRAIHEELAGIDTCYIADGHHRMAAAARYAGRSNSRDGDDAAFTLAAAFPSEQMRILGYHRCVTRPPEQSTSGLLEAITAQPVTEWLQECSPAEAVRPGPGTVGMHLDGHWYRLWLRPPRQRPPPWGVDGDSPVSARSAVDPRAALDVVALDEGILAPVLGITRVDAHADVTPVPGDEDTDRVGHWCAEHDAIAFLLHPPSVEQVMAIADAGAVMPPKSTCFAPKATTGLFVREFA